jgi:hypothetical protein
MSLSFTVFYNTEKKVFKSVSPSTLLQQILTESAEAFKVNPNRCVLKYRKNPLDPSQPLRFSNIPNNAQVDLVLNSSGGKQVCKIALTCVENGTSFQGTFPDSSSLIDVLEEAKKEIPFPTGLSPELVYMRASFQTQDSLMQTTLVSLGLSG